MIALTHAGGLSSASEFPTAQPEAVGMSSEILEAGMSLFQEAIDSDEIRGAVILVARDGKIVLHEALGWRDVDRRLPMRRDTVFHMASNTKPIVAAAVLSLEEERKISLDDYVRKHLHSFDNYRAGWIRISHLLSHTSGFRIPGIFLSPLLANSTLQTEVARFGEIGSDETPGATFSYSNPGYNTLGALIEVVSKKPLGMFLRERIYHPLGMAETWNHESQAPEDRMSIVYERDASRAWSIHWKPGGPSRFPFTRGSGGIISTATDYLRFCQMVLDEGTFAGKRVLAAESVQRATTAAPNTDEGPESPRNGYGYGWYIWPGGEYFHSGSWGTSAMIDPAKKVIVLVLTQSRRGKNPRHRFTKVVQASVLR
jgi:CubicO group peptidase (beta-lactamase class C family)